MTNKINEYLSSGGLFNPELMEHEKVRDMVIEARDEIQPLRSKVAELELENKTLRDLLREARDDVANQLQEYQSLLPYKQHRYDAQKITLDDIDKALSTPTSTEQVLNHERL